MRPLSSLLVFATALVVRLSAATPDPITVTNTIPSQSVVTTLGTPAINLQNYFAVPSITGQVVQFKTSALTAGANTFNVEMKSAIAPNTVANFLSYVNAGRFANTIIHRTDKSEGIIQGGSYYPKEDSTYILAPVTTSSDAPIALETGDTLLNSRGTIAMGRTGNLNSATSGWFINTTDNSLSLPPASSSGYAAFGRVTGTGMSVVDALYALPPLCGNVTVTSSSTSNASVTIDSAGAPPSFGTGWTLLGSSVQFIAGNFVTLAGNANRNISLSTLVPYTLSYLVNSLTDLSQMPALASLTSPSATVYFSNLVTITSVKTVPIFPAADGAPSVVTFSAVSSDPSLVSVSVSGSNLYVAAAKNLNGSATVTVTATDSNGNQAQLPPFNVTVTRKVLDFNADGNLDFVFQNTAGQVFRWNLTGTGSILSTGFIYSGGLGDWKLTRIADMNGDGNPDFVFQNTAGQIYAWYLTSTGSIASTGLIYGGGLGDWRVAGLVDLNRDGKTDIILQNSIGQIYVWLMNGSGGIASSGYYYTGSLGDWRLVAIADMNGDGNPDFIFQNTVGQIYAWYLTPTGSIGSTGYIYGGGLGDWRLVLATDLNKDGKTDLILQNTAGQIFAWYMNGSGAISSTALIYSGGLGDWRLR